MLACSPLSFSNIWTPFLPISEAIVVLLETLLFLGEVFVVVDYNHD